MRKMTRMRRAMRMATKWTWMAATAALVAGACSRPAPSVPGL
jgi:hypothetical protein